MTWAGMSFQISPQRLRFQTPKSFVGWTKHAEAVYVGLTLPSLLFEQGGNSINPPTDIESKTMVFKLQWPSVAKYAKSLSQELIEKALWKNITQAGLEPTPFDFVCFEREHCYPKPPEVSHKSSRFISKSCFNSGLVNV